MLRSWDGKPITTIRHTAENPPSPLGCRWCGFGEREHARRFVPGRGFHTWEQPTRAQIEARMRVKFARQAVAGAPTRSEPVLFPEESQ